MTYIPSIEASGAAQTDEAAQADEVVRVLVNSMGIGSGSAGAATLHAHCVRPVAMHSGQNKAKGLLGGSFGRPLEAIFLARREVKGKIH